MSERCGDGRLAVLADHSTDGRNWKTEKVGKLDPGDPLKGRRSRALRYSGGSYGRYSEITNHINATSEYCAKSYLKLRVAK